MKQLFNQIHLYITFIVCIFCLISCVTPKPGTISNYRVNPVTGEKTCKVYVDIKYDQSVKEGEFSIEGNVTLTKKQNGEVHVDIPTEIMEAKIIDTKVTTENLKTQFHVDEQMAEEIATALIDCHENRHMYDHIKNPALVIAQIESTQPTTKSGKSAKSPLFLDVKEGLERNATGAESMLLAKILREGNGDLSEGWKHVRKAGRFVPDKGLNVHFLTNEIYEGQRKTDIYEQKAAAFTKISLGNAIIDGTEQEGSSRSYKDAFEQFEEKGYTDFVGLETQLKAVVNDTFELLEKTTSSEDKRRKEGNSFFGQKFISHTLEIGKDSVGKMVQDILNHNNNTNRPAASSTNYCWSCRVKDPGIPRCMQPSCPNYGNPPSKAR